MSLNYKVIQSLGEGSFGKAFLCQKESDNSFCVIKQIIVQDMNQKEKDDVLNEANILSKLDHQNIIKFYDLFESKKPKHSINIVTEYADGGDLSEKIKERKNKNNNFSESEILDYFTQICLAIKHIHEKKIIHRDLKSGNIFLMKTGLVKLGDFGISKKFMKTMEKAKTMVGTPYYLSPEIISGNPYDAKSDIWSLGVLLYEMMTFKMPFNANNFSMLVAKIQRGNYIPPPSIYTKDLRELVSKCLTLEPERRPSIQEIIRMPIIQNRIKSFLDEVQYNKEFSKTITKKYKENKVVKTNEIKGLNVEVFEPKVITGNPIPNMNIKKNENNNNNKKIVDYFKQRNLKKEKDEKERDKKRQDFKDFLKVTKKSKKWGGIDQNQYNESGVMWGKNQDSQKPIIIKEENTEELNLNDLLDSYDVDKITEEQYDKARFLNNLDDNIINEEKEKENNNKCEEMNDIVNQQGQNNTIKEENNSDSDNEIYSEFNKIELIRMELEKSIGLKLFIFVYNYIYDEIYNNKAYDENIIKDKVIKELENKKYNQEEIDLIIQKLPEIFSLILKEKSIEQ